MTLHKDTIPHFNRLIHIYGCNLNKSRSPLKYKMQGSTLRVNLWPQASKNSQKQLRASKKDLNWSYRASKHLETFLLKSFPPRMSPNVFEINEDKIYKDQCCGESYAMFLFVMLKKKSRTSKHFSGPADTRCYWSYRDSIILSKRWGLRCPIFEQLPILVTQFLNPC